MLRSAGPLDMGGPDSDPGSIGVPVISSKIVPPSPPVSEVVRPRLAAALDSDRQVVTITAPAGYGKSALVAGWVHRSPERRIAWVSLDQLDRNPVSFWRHVTTAIAQVVPRASEADLILVERGAAGPEFLAALIHALDEDEEPVVLVLDDLHHVEAVTIRDGLTTLVERCGETLRLIALSRTDPPIPTRRWLAEGRAVELRLTDLVFNTDEAGILLSRFDISGLEEDHIARLNAHVEGWAVGLLLSALTLEGRPDMALTLDDLINSDRHLADYLVDEVLDRLPHELRQLALTLAAPTYFDLEIAQRITDRPDVGELFENLIRSNPFIVHTPSPPAYRFHHLIRSLLDAISRRQDPTSYERAHRAAAAVMRERGHIADAIASLLAIGAADEAFDLVTTQALRILDDGRVRELTQWLEMLGDVTPSDGYRALDYSLALALTGRPYEAIAWAERAQDLGGTDDPGFAGAHAAVWMTAVAGSGFIERAAECWPILDAIGGDVIGSTRLDARASGQIVRLALELDDLARAERWLPEVGRHPEPSISTVLHPALQSWLSLKRGRVPEALRLGRAASSTAETLGLRPHVAAFDALLSKGSAELQALELDDAQTTLAILAEDADAVPMPFFLLRWWPLQFSHRALSEGWPAALALTATWNLDEFPERGGALAVRHEELRATALLNCGIVDEVAPVLDRLGTGTRTVLLRARNHLVVGSFPRVEEALAGYPSWELPERLEALLILAQARSGSRASETMRAALALGHESGFVAPFVLEGRRAQQLIDDLPVDELHPGLAAWRRGSRSRVRGEPRSTTLIEPLTARELEVLIRLPSHATYRAIGAQLFVSVNTVKTYVSGVYRKLGVSSRAEAVEVARQCGLLDP